MGALCYPLCGVTVFWSQLQFGMATVRSGTGKPASPDLSYADLLWHVNTVLTKGLGSGTAATQNWLPVHTVRKGNELSQKESIILILPSVFLQIYWDYCTSVFSTHSGWNTFASQSILNNRKERVVSILFKRFLFISYIIFYVIF